MFNLRTRAQKVRHALATQRLMASLERSHRALLMREFMRVAKEAADLFPITMMAIKDHEDRLKRILMRIHIETARLFAKRYREERGKSHPWMLEMKMDTAAELDARIVSWAEGRAGNKLAGDIADSTRKKISKVISDGLGKNEHPDKIAKSIREAVEGLAPWRANTIARTETHAAAMTGEITAVEADGVAKTKEWVSTNDERTREDHDAANGQIVNMESSFIVGGERLDYPGDPSGDPGQIINCRCVLVYGVNEDDVSGALEEVDPSSYDKPAREEPTMDYVKPVAEVITPEIQEAYRATLMHSPQEAADLLNMFNIPAPAGHGKWTAELADKYARKHPNFKPKPSASTPLPKPTPVTDKPTTPAPSSQPPVAQDKPKPSLPSAPVEASYTTASVKWKDRDPEKDLKIDSASSKAFAKGKLQNTKEFKADRELSQAVGSFTANGYGAMRAVDDLLTAGMSAEEAIAQGKSAWYVNQTVTARKAFTKMTQTTIPVAWRGIGMGESEWKEIERTGRVGWTSMSSASIDPNQSWKFADQGDEVMLLMRITNARGVVVEGISAHPEEREILLPGSKKGYKITKITTVNNGSSSKVRILDVEEIKSISFPTIDQLQARQHVNPREGSVNVIVTEDCVWF